MKLSELIREQEEISLSAIQKYILIAIHTSDTPVLAFDRIRDSESDTVSSNMLARFGFIQLSRGQAGLTEKGKQALISYGLTDETGEVTEVGQEIVANYEDEDE